MNRLRTRQPPRPALEPSPVHDPIEVVDTALGRIVGRRMLHREELRAMAGDLGDAACGEVAIGVAEFALWAWLLDDGLVERAPVADALLDLRLALAAPVNA